MGGSIRYRYNRRLRPRSFGKYKQRICRKFPRLVEEIDFCPEIMEGNSMGKHTYIGASDIRDFKIAQWFEAYNKPSLINREINLHVNKPQWFKFIESINDILEDKKYSWGKVFEFAENYGTVFFEEGYIDYHLHTRSIEAKIFGMEEFVHTVTEVLERDFETVSSYIEWMYSSDGSSARVPMSVEKLPISEMYPFLGSESIESYYDRYLNSSANILVLIGPPGTGKTTFIRGLLSHANQSATVTYDANILEKDYIFAQFIEGDTQIMVMEDCDRFLSSRSDGNTMMHKFLNVGDGLVTTRGKKLIFSTNLPSIKDIDDALIRPGRCFDVISFQPLDRLQANILANKLDVKLEDKDNYTIAEIFHKQSFDKSVKVKGKVGFV